MSVQYATIIEQSAWLNSKFGLELAQLWTGFTVEMLEGIVSRNKKGARKGQLKGQLTWKKVTVGGWSHKHGGVLYPGTIFHTAIVDPWKINERTRQPEILLDVDMIRDSSGPVKVIEPVKPEVVNDAETIRALELSIEEHRAVLTPLQLDVLNKLLADMKSKQAV